MFFWVFWSNLLQLRQGSVSMTTPRAFATCSMSLSPRPQRFTSLGATGDGGTGTVGTTRATAWFILRAMVRPYVSGELWHFWWYWYDTDMILIIKVFAVWWKMDFFKGLCFFCSRWSMHNVWGKELDSWNQGKTGRSHNPHLDVAPQRSSVNDETIHVARGIHYINIISTSNVWGTICSAYLNL